MACVYLGLGTNLGDRIGNLRQAVAALGQWGQVQDLSAVYETAPLYVTDQPAFLNMAVSLHTPMPPAQLLQTLKSLETQLGRISGTRYGPRLIDLDILLYQDQVLSLPDLDIPHPRLHERRFALAPLADIASAVIHPVLGHSIGHLLAGLTDTDPVALFAPALS